MDQASLDHVAIAVLNLDLAQKVYEDLGLVFDATREVVAKEQVTTAFAKIGEHCHLELLQPLDGQGPIQKFLDQKGPGIHHLCYRVKNIEATCRDLKAKGYRLIYDAPSTGAGGAKVNFIHPKSTGGVLIELSEKGSA